MGAFAGKPGSYGLGGCPGLGAHTKPVEAGLLAMAILRTPSPASRLLRIGGCSGLGIHAKPVGARLAGDGDFTDAFAGKPAPTDWGMFGIGDSRQTCRSPACRRWRFHGRHRRQAWLLQIAGMFGIGDSHQTCRSPACWRWRFHGRHRRQAWLLRIAGMSGIEDSRKTCRSPACWRWRFYGRHRRQAWLLRIRACWGL
ncbi:hypothetical protein J2Y74_002141 [Pseudomonas migulae]|nr:hypothetical protein [Pseudomonas migulae]